MGYRFLVLTAVVLLINPPGRLAAAQQDTRHDSEIQAAVSMIGGVLAFRRHRTASSTQIELGRRLFSDPRISLKGKMSCSTCHIPAHHFSDGLRTAIGTDGRPVGRNAPSLEEAAFYTELFWDGRASTIEDAVLIAVHDPQEMDMPVSVLIAKLSAIPEYGAAFSEDFPGVGISSATVARALSAYIISLAPREDSPFDHFLEHGTGLSPSALRGFLVFSGKANCIQCHTSRYLNHNHRYFNIGLKPASPADLGRFPLEQTPDSWGAFRIPSLRNIAFTAPYMHDGRFPTLEAVIDFYNRGGDGTQYQSSAIKPLHLTQPEKSDLLSFLRALSSSEKPAEEPQIKGPAPGIDMTALGRPFDPGRMVKDLVARASAQVSKMEELESLAAASDFMGNAAWVSRQQASRYCRSSPMTIAELPDRDRNMLFACFALMAEDPDVCRKIPGAFLDKNSFADCVGSLEHMSLFLDIMSPGLRSLKACGAGFGILNPPISPEQRGAACRALAQAGSETSRCLAFKRRLPSVFIGATLKDCTDHVAYLMTGRGCEAFHPESDQRVLCATFSKFRKADTGHVGPGACGSDYLCRALSGDAEACAAEKAGRIAMACGPSPDRMPGGAVTPASPALRREIFDTVSWAAYLAVLQPSQRQALSDLDAMMRGRRVLEPKRALADMMDLRAANAMGLLYRAEQMSGSRSGENDEDVIRSLQGRIEKALAAAGVASAITRLTPASMR